MVLAEGESGLAGCLPSRVDDWLVKYLKDFSFKKRAEILWHCAVRALVWLLWKERNQRAFEDKQVDDNIFLE